MASTATVSRRVAWQSALLGRESPLGWLCARRIPALPCSAASADDGSRGEVRTAGIAFVPGQVQAVGFAIDVRDPQALSSGIGLGKAAGEKNAGRLESVQLERLCGTLIAHGALLCGTTSSHDSNRVRVRPDFIHNRDSSRACTRLRQRISLCPACASIST